VTSYSTPDVYFEWLDAAHRIDPASTAVAGFVGIAERGPLHQAVRLRSWTQFQSIFGERIAQGYLAYAVQGFFANGGSTCFAVRVADPETARRAQIDLVEVSPLGGARLRLTASSEGKWAHRMTVSVLFITTGRFTLTLTLPSGQQEIFRDLSLNEEDPRNAERIISPWRYRNPGSISEYEATKRFIDAKEGSKLVEAEFVGPGVPPAASELALSSILQFGRMKGGADGLGALQPEHFNSDLSAENGEWGLAVLKKEPEVAMVAIPDLIPTRDEPPTIPTPPPDCSIPETPPLPPDQPDPPDLPPVFESPQIQALEFGLIRHCELLKDRVALLHTLPNQSSPTEVIAHRRQFDSSYAAFFFPWIRVPNPPGMDDLLRAVPPCGHIAGIYARSELNKGVHKPAANEVVETAQDLSVDVDDVMHGLLNEAQVNVMRISTARGIRLMGARTISSDPLWLFMNVRRLLINIERGIQASSQWLPFETNNPDLWRDVDRILRVYLTGMFQRGMLDGNTPEDAFFVDCSIATNPPSVTDEGQMIAVIGLRPPPPAEFVIVRIGRTDSGLDFIEGT
jgi:uncharacterized protein